MEPDDTFRKRGRVSGDVGGSSAGDPDRLSSLPDCFLHTIMSFLKARQVVQTCVLSTRWKHLWRTVPCLDIDFDEFSNKAPPSDSDSSSSGSDTYDSDSDTYDSDSDSDTSNSDSHRGLLHDLKKRMTKYIKDWEPFEDFAVTLMNRCNIAQLDSFRLRIARSRDPVFSERLAAGWLRRAMKYGTPHRGSKLGLSSGSWRLKRLHLCHVLFDDHLMKCVSSVCRSLEDLELDGCSCELQSITSDSLKTLVLRNCGCHSLSEIISPTLKTLVIDGGSNRGVRVLVIVAPALAYLHLALNIYRFCGGVSLNVPSIGKAFIHLVNHKFYYARSKLDGDQSKLLCSISNSTNIELLGVGTRVLSKEPRFQEFKNLRNLLLNSCDLSEDFGTLVFFLRGSPILEKLTLRFCEFPKCSSEKNRMPMLRFQEFKNLRSLLLEYCDLSDDIRTLMFFLQSFPMLEKLILRRCKFPEYSSKKEGAPILDKTSSSELRGLDLLCENLKVEIIYDNGHGPHLIRLLQRVSVNLSKDNIKLKKVI